MGARKQLNVAFINGGLLLGTLAGVATSSWVVFAGAVVASIALDCYVGNIRWRPPNRRS